MSNNILTVKNTIIATISMIGVGFVFIMLSYLFSNKYLLVYALWIPVGLYLGFIICGISELIYLRCVHSSRIHPDVPELSNVDTVVTIH